MVWVSRVLDSSIAEGVGFLWWWVVASCWWCRVFSMCKSAKCREDVYGVRVVVRLREVLDASVVWFYVVSQ